MQQKELFRQQVHDTIREKAQERLEKARRDESAFEPRRQKLRDAKEAEIQWEARNYMRLQERKQKALDEERRWRRENIYRGADPGMRRNALIDDPRRDPRRSKVFPHVTKPIPKPKKRRERELPIVGVGRSRIPVLRELPESYRSAYG
jgi:hypothetical protein